MKLLKILIVSAIVASSSSAFAEGGAERSQEYWAQFKLSQQQVHGAKNSTDVQSTAKTDSQDMQTSGKKSES